MRSRPGRHPRWPGSWGRGARALVPRGDRRGWPRGTSRAVAPVARGACGSAPRQQV